MVKEQPQVTRRGFMLAFRRILGWGSLGILFGPITAYFWPRDVEDTPSEPLVLGMHDSIAQGDSRTVRFGRYPALVINTPQVGLVAYSAVCTHFACIVKWNADSGMIECPCHAGFYDPLDGSVISGPPPLPLDKIRISKAGDTITLLPSA